MDAGQTSPPEIDFSGLVPQVVEFDLLAAINAFRASYALKPLANNPALNLASQQFSDRMAARGEIWHDANAQIAARIRDAGFNGRYSGEIVAMAPTVEEAVKAWVGSPPHRSIMMNAHNVMGGAVTRTLKTGWWCIDFGVI